MLRKRNSHGRFTKSRTHRSHKRSSGTRKRNSRGRFLRRGTRKNSRKNRADRKH